MHDNVNRGRKSLRCTDVYETIHVRRFLLRRFAGACFLSSDVQAQSNGKQGTTNPKSGTGSGNPKSGTGNPGTGNPGTGNPGTGNPGTGNPGTGNPGTGNPLPTFPAPPIAKKKIGRDYQAQMTKNVETALFNKFLTDSLTNAAIRPNPLTTPISSPFNNPFSSPFNSPFSSPFNSPFSSPFNSPFSNNPFSSLQQQPVQQ